MRTAKYFAIVSICMTVMFTVNVQAAFIVEAHESGLANGNFEGSGSASLKSSAPGLTATNSLFGGSNDYLYYYTPWVDVDNVDPPFEPELELTNGHQSSGLEGGLPGVYNVYITWPATDNVKPEGCNITVTSEGDDIFLDPIDMNSGGTGSPGGNSGWYLIGEKVRLVTGRTYSVHQIANNPAFVGQRSHGVMWELVEPEEPLADIIETGGETSVEEGGDNDEYSLVLKEQPLDTVVVTAQVSEPNQITLNGEDKLELTFTPDDWNIEQVVTVVAVEDALTEPGSSVWVLHMTASDPNAQDPNSVWDDGFVGLVTVAIRDFDVPTVRITETTDGTEVSEEGPTSDNYTAKLLFPPTDNVTITITTDGQTVVDTGAGAGETAELVFGPDDWDQEKMVTVTAVDDEVLEGDHASVITHTVSSLDGGYDGLTVRNVDVAVDDNECGAWGYLELDYDKNCVVDLADLAYFASFWMECTQPYGQNCDDLR